MVNKKYSTFQREDSKSLGRNLRFNSNILKIAYSVNSTIRSRLFSSLKCF